MNIPRLVFAEERRAKKTSAGILLASVLKGLGRPVRLFSAGYDEQFVRYAELVTGQEVTILNPFTCGSSRNMKLLFQQASSSDALNIVFGSLGERQEIDSFTVNPLTGEVARILDCPVVLSVYADSSTAITSKILESITLQMSTQGAQPSAVLFSSAFNPREYQLLEIESGRKTAMLYLGYIPKTMEKDESSLLELCLPDMAQRAVFPIKAATAQITGMLNQVEWDVLWGLAKKSPEWSVVSDSMKGKGGGVKVGILSNPAFELGGNNAELLFRYLGCSVRTVPLDGAAPDPKLDALYVPHAPGFLCAERLLGKSGIRDWFLSFFSRKPVLVGGGVAPLLGGSFSLPNNKRYEGLKLFPFQGLFSIPSSGDSRLVEAVSSFGEDIMLNRGEKIRGYIPGYLSIQDPGNTASASWSVVNPSKSADIGLSGWCKGPSIVTEICLELWSNMEGVHRWLMMRKA